MDTSFLRKKWFKVLALILLLLVILLMIANAIVSRKAESVLHDKLASADTSSYVIGFEDVKVNIFTRTVKIFDVSIRPSAAAMEHLRNEIQSPVRIEANIKKIKVGNIGVLDALTGKSLDIGNMVVDDPVITLYSPQYMFPDKKAHKKRKTPEAADSNLSVPFDEAFLNVLRVNNATINWVNVQADRNELLAGNLYLRMDDIHVYHPKGDSASFMLDVDDISLELSHFQILLPGKLYTVRTNKIAIGYADGNMRIDSLKLIPSYPKEKFGHVVGKQTDHFDLAINHLLISGIEFDSIINNKVITEKVTLDRPVANIYRDKAIPRDMSHFPNLYQTTVAGLPFGLNISLVEINDASITYQEKAEWATEPGGVIFDDFDIRITGILNDPEILKNGHSMKLEGKALLMGKADLNIHLDLPIGRHDEYFTLYGTSGPFKAELLNPLMAPLAALEAKSGTFNKCSFYVLGKNDTAVARTLFLYEGMEMSFLQKGKQAQGKISENKFLSLLVKAALNKDNPQKGKEVVVGLGNFVRDPNKGFFNYAWKTIQDGLVNTMIPMQKNHAQDMDWETFENKWEQVLKDDRASLGKAADKRSKRQKN